jgi:lipoprotein-releasing system permease protein
VTGVRLRLADLFDAPRVSARVAEAASTAAGRALRATDWTRENATYFRAIRLEKTMMATMLLLVVAVAAFNIVASLVMVVTEKRTDVAILRTLGLAPERVTRIFMLQGSVIGVLGTGLGVAAGLAMALNVETIVPWLESTFGFQIMPGDVYYVTNIPSETHAGDVVLIAFAGLVLGVLATVYPSRRAGRVAPAEALRYD